MPEAEGLAFMPMTEDRDGAYVLALSGEIDGATTGLHWVFPDRDQAHLFVLLCRKVMSDT